MNQWTEISEIDTSCRTAEDLVETASMHVPASLPPGPQGLLSRPPPTEGPRGGLINQEEDERRSDVNWGVKTLLEEITATMF